MKIRIFCQRYWSEIILSLLIALYILTFSSLSILRHQAFASSFDSANMDQTIWNTLHGHFFQITGINSGVSRFSIHADIILIIFSPIYYIWNDIRSLFILQSVFLGLGALPVYLISIKIFSKNLDVFWSKLTGLCLAFTYLLNPGLEWSNIYGFHGVTLAVPFLLFAFYFIFSGRFKLFIIFALLAALTKEEISLTVAFIGFYIALRLKRYKLGLATLFLSIFWFTFTVFWLIPHFSSNNQHWGFYWFKTIITPISMEDEFSEPDTNIISSLFFLEPKIIFHKFFQAPDVWGYYLSLLKPFTFLPILGLPWLFFSLPELMINVVSDQAQMRSVRFHYDSGLTPGLLLGAIFGLNFLYWFIFKKLGLGRYKRYFIILILMAIILVGLRVNYHWGPLPITPSCWCLIYQPTEQDLEFDSFLRTLPENAKIVASSEVRPHLTHRVFVDNTPGATESAEFIALIDQHRLIGSYRPKRFESKLIQVLKDHTDFKLIYQNGHFYVFKNTKLTD